MAYVTLAGYPGVDPTGVNDSTGGINNAIAVAQSGGITAGAVVYFPPGTYKVSGQLVNAAGTKYPITLMGDGSRGSSTIKWSSTSTTVGVNFTFPAATDHYGLQLIIRDLSLICDKPNGGTAITATWGNTDAAKSGSAALIENLHISGGSSDSTYFSAGISLTNAPLSIIRNLNFRGGPDSDFTHYATDAILLNGHSVGTKISNCFLQQCTTGIRATGYTVPQVSPNPPWLMWSEGIFVVNCHIVHAAYGIKHDMGTTNLGGPNITNSHFDTDSFGVWVKGATWTTINGINLFKKGHGAPNPYCGVYLESCSAFQISDCTINLGSVNTESTFGVYSQDSLDGLVATNYVTPGTPASQRWGVYIDDSSWNVRAFGNLLRGLSASQRVRLPNVGAPYNNCTDSNNWG